MEGARPQGLNFKKSPCFRRIFEPQRKIINKNTSSFFPDGFFSMFFSIFPDTAFPSSFFLGLNKNGENTTLHNAGVFDWDKKKE